MTASRRKVGYKSTRNTANMTSTTSIINSIMHK